MNSLLNMYVLALGIVFYYIARHFWIFAGIGKYCVDVTNICCKSEMVIQHNLENFRKHNSLS